MRQLFSPLLPPFGGHVKDWYNRNMSDTNESYFDLLSDTLIISSPIFLPSDEQVTEYKVKLNALLDELNDLNFPRWVNDEFREAIGLTLIALEKMPFLAHRIVREAHSNILSKLFASGDQKQKSYVVRLATTINIVLAAFVMPHEAAEATNTYYDWAIASPVDTKQIEACAKPLALPAPKVTKM